MPLPDRVAGIRNFAVYGGIMDKTIKRQVTKKEFIAYCLFFLGQNILWGYAGYIETFLTDIGIAAARAAALLIVPKLWDAVNDVLFGYVLDRFTFKNGEKYRPWIRVGVSAVGITTVALFAIPASLSESAKVVWFLIAYILFDAAYTVLDSPAFAITTVMTTDVDERSRVIAGGKLWAMVGGVVATVVIPLVRPKLGWFTACIVFVIVSLLMMIPLIFNAHERHASTEKANVNPTLKDMLGYLKSNKYLLVTLIAFFLLGIASLEQKMAIYAGRICFGNESMATLVAAGASLSVIVVSFVVPKLFNRWDKFNILIAGLIFSIVMDVVTYFVGFGNLVVALIFITLKCSGLGFWSVIIYMLVADTVEYGAYKSGSKAAGITFSLQTFIAKLKNAVIGSVVLTCLASVGFVEGENQIQTAAVADGVWGLFCLFPAAGFLVALLILIPFYKLRTKDVQVMAKYNNGEITKAEAEDVLMSRYGAAADR